MPTIIREYARARAGEVGHIASGVFSSGKLLTAVHNGSDRLELIVWAPDAATRTFARLSDSHTQAGDVGAISLAMMGERCVTAVQNGDGKLLLIPWALEPDGTISRLEVHDNQEGKASDIASIALSDTVLVTAFRNGAGNMHLIPWSVDTAGHVARLDGPEPGDDPEHGGSVANGSTVYVGPLIGNAPTSIAVPLAGPLIAGAAIDESHFATAKINKHGGLELATWALNAANQPTRQWAAPIREQLASSVWMAPLGGPGPTRTVVLAYRRITPVVTPGVRTASLQTELIVSVWAASASGDAWRNVAHASTDDLGAFAMTVGSIGPAARTLIFLSGSGGNDLLVNVTFEMIGDTASSGMAVILTGRLHDDGYRDIDEVAPAFLTNGQFVTTVGNDDGFGLVAYNLGDTSATLIRPLADGEFTATRARVQALNGHQAIAAVRNSAGQLELISWDVAAQTFAVTPAADTSGHPIGAGDVALVLRGQQAVTAISADPGNLRLDSWNIAPDLSSIDWQHQTGTAAGGADCITATLLEPDLVVTAVRDLSRNLLLIVWRIETDGTLSRLNHEDAQAGRVDIISLAALDASNVVTSVRGGGGNLLVIGWTIGTDGSVTRWKRDGHAGEVREIASATLNGADASTNIVTAVRDGSDGLLVIVWRASVADRTITRLTDSGDEGHDDGDGTDIAVCICATPPSLRPSIVTSRRRGGRNLKVVTWQLLDDDSGAPMLIQTGNMTDRADQDVRPTDICALEPGRVLLATGIGLEFRKQTRLSTVRVSDAQIPHAPAELLTLIGDNNVSAPTASDWADGTGTYPTDRDFEWQQVLDAANEYDDTPLSVSGWVVKPEESGADMPFSHPFGFDWEFAIAVDKGFEGFVSPANAVKEEQNGSPNENEIGLAGQLGLVTPTGLLGLEWEKDLLPTSYRGQVNHGDRVAVLGRWIFDNGHNIENQFRTEIHPPLLLASANVVQSESGNSPRTRALFISRPYLSGQTFTTNLATRDQDHVDDDGSLISHATSELHNVLEGRSSQLEVHSKIKGQPFCGDHSATFLIGAPGPRPGPDAQLLVSYRFDIRTPCRVRLTPRVDANGIEVKIDLSMGRGGREMYQVPELPASRTETYSTDRLNLLSQGAGDEIGWIQSLIEIFTPVVGPWAKYVFDKGIETDVFDSQPQFDFTDPAGGVTDLPVAQLAANTEIIENNRRVYPVTGWVELYWANPVIT